MNIEREGSRLGGTSKESRAFYGMFFFSNRGGGGGGGLICFRHEAATKGLRAIQPNACSIEEHCTAI